MECPACKTENPETAKFCQNCGAKLILTCAECGTELPSSAKFCYECGALIAEPAASPLMDGEGGKVVEAMQRLVPQEYAKRLREAGGRVSRERRLVTILFSDVKGSTAMGENFDPEEVMEIMDGAFDVLIEPVYKYEGTLARLMGDAVLAFFGAPIGHEDDPERAIRSGLEIVAGAKEYAARLQEERGIGGFNVRVGINTGLVVVGEVGSDLRVEYTAMGDTINLAARMEQNAPPGGVLITHDTYKLVRGVFDVQPQEPISVKGKAEPVATYLVERAKPRAFRVTTRGVEGIETRMVGREAELKSLQDALYAAVEDGEGQIITILGEAGVGKSRLLYEFTNWIDLLPQKVRFFQGRARQDAQNQPYALLYNLFVYRFSIQDGDRGDEIQEKLEAGFGEVFGGEESGQMRAHIIGQLLGFDFSESPHLKGVLEDAQQLRDRSLIYLDEYFQGVSTAAPTVVFLEDIHWADDSSLDFINRLARKTPERSILILCLARPVIYERRQHWGEGLDYHIRQEIKPLTKRGSRLLVDEILQRVDQVPIELRDLVVKGAEGNPFFIEELIKMLLEDGVIVKYDEHWRVEKHRLAAIDVPSTLTGVLQTRLDSLSPQERVVLQQASVVGRQFWDQVVAHIQAAEGGNPQGVPETLTSLRGRELVYRHEESTFADTGEYIFKHDILREVTYESVLKSLRRVYHGLVADWLIVQGAQRPGEYSALIAGHLLQAGREDQAVVYFLQAGESALASYAIIEAEAHFRKALSLSPNKPQLAACFAGLGEALDRQGRVDKAVQTLRQAIDLSYEMGEYDQVAQVYSRLSSVLFSKDYQNAWNACQEGLARLEGTPDGPGMARLLAEAGRMAFFVAKPANDVIDLCQRAIEMANRVGDLEVGADAMITLALQEGKNNNYLKAITILEQVVELAESNELLYITFRAHTNLGNFFDRLMDPSGYVEHSIRAIVIGKQISRNYSYSVSNLIEGYIKLGRLNDAQTFLKSIPQINAAPVWEKEFYTLANRGAILYASGDWYSALRAIQKCIVMLRQRESIQVIVGRNLELAIAITELDRFGFDGNLLEAETALRENLELRGKIIETYCQLCTVSARQGRIQDASVWLDQARDRPGEQELSIFMELQAGAEFELAFAEESWDEAVAVCESSIDILHNSGYRWGWARRLIDLGDALLGRNAPGDRERAEEAYRQSLAMFTEMGAPGYCEVLEPRLGELEQ